VSDLQWVPYGTGSLLITCSSDGNIVCIDMTDSSYGLVASGQVDSGLRCIRCDPQGMAGSLSGLTIFAGFADGSIRLLSMQDGGFTDVDRHMMVHPGGVTALCISEKGDLLVSGGDDGCVRVWEIK
jgi:WD40 repeat protein